MASAAFCGIFQISTRVPARVEDEAVAMYRIVERRKIATIKGHVLRTFIRDKDNIK